MIFSLTCPIFPQKSYTERGKKILFSLSLSLPLIYNCNKSKVNHINKLEPFQNR